MPGDVTIYATGDKTHGLGHVKRMSLLARELSARGLSVRLASEPGTIGWDILAQTRLPLTQGYRMLTGHLAIVDIENGPDEYLLGILRDNFGQVVTVYGGFSFPTPEPGFDAAEQLSDLVICQSIFEFDRPAHVLQGAPYLIIDPRYASNWFNPAGDILVVMGGTDPHDLTPQVLAALPCRRVSAPRGKPDLVAEMWGKSLFIGAQGMTAYEAIAAGLPALLYGWTDNAVATARELEQMGVARSMGLWSDFDPVRLVDLACGSIWNLKNQGPRIIDGRGLARVAERICQLIGVTA